MEGAAGRGARKVAKIFFFPAHEEGSVAYYMCMYSVQREMGE